MNRRTLFVLFALIISFAFIHYIKYIIINDEVEESTLEEVAILETDLGILNNRILLLVEFNYFFMRRINTSKVFSKPCTCYCEKL